MATKRSIDDVLEDIIMDTAGAAAGSIKLPKIDERIKKHTLDSDEEDSGDDERYNILNENDIEGEEDGITKMDGEVKLTPFNMKEEMEEGHFDAEGHFQWNKNDDIKDNWLDNLDWVKIKPTENGQKAVNQSDSSDSEDEKEKEFDLIAAYRRMLALMQPKETVKRSLQRLGGKGAKVSSIDRWKRKKAGIEDSNDSKLVTELTELANTILTRTGNMDIYFETYEMIESKCFLKPKSGGSSTTTAAPDDGLDMYADDFVDKEKTKLVDSQPAETETQSTDDSNDIQWEFKWKQTDEDVHGPFGTAQMQQWVQEGYFKDGVFVRKIGQEGQFNSSNRIDFELYL